MKNYIILITVVLLTTLTTMAFKFSFTDVKEKDWFYQPIMQMTDKKIMTGYEDNTFRPYNNVNRAELAEVLSAFDDDVLAQVSSLNDQIDELHARLKILEDKAKIDLNAEKNTTVKNETVPNNNTPNDATINTNTPNSNTTEDSFADSWNTPKTEENKVKPEIKENSNINNNVNNNNTSVKNEAVVKNIEINLDQKKELMNGYSLFTESRYKQFELQYPKNYFWNNAIGTKKKDLGYLWYIAFGSKDFSEMEETDFDNNTDMSISIVKNNKIVSSAEVQIYVKINNNEYFLLEGKKAYATQLELMAGSLQKIKE